MKDEWMAQILRAKSADTFKIHHSYKNTHRLYDMNNDYKNTPAPS